MSRHPRKTGQHISALRRSRGRKHRDARRRLTSPERLEARIVLDSTVVFNEIMYHTDDDDALEFVELYNQNSVNVDLSAWRLSGGVDFTFPRGTVLDGGEYLVIAKDPAAFQAQTGFTTALGPFAGLLDNGGETLNLRNNTDRLMDTLDYSDGGDWPVGADGSGSSLAKLQRMTPSDFGENWATSSNVGGTPGAVNFVDDTVTLPRDVDLIDANTPAQTLVPTAGESGLGTAWTERGFDTTTWTSGGLGVGYDSDISVIPDSTLNRYYPLDADADDESGNNFNGAVSGAVFSAEVAPALAAGGSLELDGVNDRVVINDGTQPSAYTISAWVKPDVIKGQSIVVRTAGDPLSTWSHQIRMTSAGRFEAYTYDGSVKSVVGATVATAGQWYHVLAAAENNGVMRLYVNGVEEGFAATVNTLWASGTQWQIGSNSGDASGAGAIGFFDGLIDDVAIFTDPLGQTQITALASGVGPREINGFAGAINTDLQLVMENINASAWVRTEFAVTATQVFDQLALKMRYDDGFIAYLNGTKVAERNAPAQPAWDSSATAENPDVDALTGETIDLTSFIHLLETGNNVLAIHGLNESATDTDFLIFPELTGHLSPVIFDDASLAINEVASALDAEFWVELSNTGMTPVNLSGLVLSNTERLGAEFVLPDVSLAAGEYIVFDEATLGFGADDEDALMLFAPNKTSVVDAVRVKNRSQARLPDGSGIWQTPDAATMGSANRFDINDDIVINEIQYHARPVYATPGVPAITQLTTLVSFSDSWRYNQSGADLGTNWYSTAHPVDGAQWFSGPGLIGFEPNGTPQPIGTLLTNPQINSPRVTTYYFETEFNFSSGGATLEDFSLLFNTLIDDGAVFYLNGAELPLRQNMPAGTITAGTFSATAGEASPTSLAFEAGLLQEGVNRLAVEVHQGSANSSDVLFGLEVQISEPLVPSIPGDPFAESDEEWIELYNRSATETVDLSGWEFRDGVSFTFPLNTMLAPGEYLVIARDPAALEAKFSGTFNAGDVLGPLAGTLSNSNETVSLVDANKNIVDQVHYYDDTNWASAADGGGSSLELRDPNADNAVAEAWAASDESNRSSWQSYSYTRTVQPLVHAPPVNFHELVMGLLDEGEVLIDNITVTDVTGGGSVQLLQNTNFESDNIGLPAARWRFVGTHDASRVVADPDNPGNKVLLLSAESAMGYFANRAETTLAVGAQVVNGRTYEISFDAKWISGSPQFHTELYYKDAARTTILEMPEISGTPGAQNSTFEPNIGPTYRGLSQFPVVPSSSDSVSISVAASDPDGIATISLVYAVNGGGFSTAPMIADANGVYSADVPPRTNGGIVQFFVQGEDTSGAISTFPADGVDSRALYKVNDSYTPDPLRQDLQIIMLSGEASALHLATEYMDNNRVGSTVVYNGNEVFYNVGTRLKGSMFSRNNQGRTGYNIQFHPDQLFRGIHETITLDQANEQEIQVSHLANQTDVIGGVYNDVIQLTTPTGVGGGPTVLGMARHGNVFLDEQFDNGSEGELYRFEGIRVLLANNPPEALKTFQPVGWVGSFDLDDLGDDKELYRWPYLLKNNRSEDNFDELSRMAKAFSLSGSALQDALDEAIDVDQWMSTFALMSLAGIGDVYSQGNPHNLNFYVRPEDGKVLAFPWDWDFTFNRSTNSPLHGNKNIAKAIDLPVNERIFFGHMLNMVETYVNGSYMAEWASHYGAMLGLGFSGTAGYLDARGAFVTSAIRSNFPPVSFGINTTDPLVIADTLATIEGSGWVNVREIRLSNSNQPLEVQWNTSGGSNADLWQVTLPIDLGRHSYTFEAYDFQGNLIGSDTIVIESTDSDSPLQDFLRISEVMYNPPVAPPGGLQHDNDDFEFIELTNIGDQPIDLRDARFTSGIEYTFDANELQPGEYALVVRNQTAFEDRYGPGLPVAGEFVGGLGNGGEEIRLLDVGGRVIAEFSYDDNGDWPSLADGKGASLVVIDTAGNYDDAGNWHASVEYGGSPGAAGLGRFRDVVINEVLTHTDPPQIDAIELHNVTSNPIDIGGWFLSDTSDDYRKYQFPNGSEIPAGGYVVLDESDFNVSMGVDPGDFALNGAHGDQLYLVAANELAQLTRFVDGVEFSAAANGESFGLWPDENGVLYPMAVFTPGAENSGPRVGPLVINEVNYHPLDPGPEVNADDLEFVEILNPTATDVDLTGWQLGGGIDFQFPAGTTIAPDELMVIVSFDPTDPLDSDQLAAFRSAYNLDAGIPLLGSFSGRLDNAGDRVQLLRPDEPPLEEPDFVPMLLEDEIVYDDAQPWPMLADGGGASLNRVESTAWGRDATSWRANGASPGRVGTPPRFMSVVINGSLVDPADLNDTPQPSSWAVQRSSLQTLVVNFSEPVVAEAADFRLTNLGINSPVDPDSDVSLTDEQIVAVGASIIIILDGFSDGVYELEILPSITDLGDTALDGNGDGTVGDGVLFQANGVNRFYQLTSNFNGDAGVTIFDFSTFAYWFGQSVGVAPAYVDMNGDGGITIFDFSLFAERFGQSIVLPPAFGSTFGQEIVHPENAAEASEESPENDVAIESKLAPVWNEIRSFPRIDASENGFEFEERDAVDGPDLESVLEEIAADVGDVWAE